MALSLAEKMQVIYLLGYPGKVLVESSTHFDRVLSNRVDNLTVEIETIARQLLEEITVTKAKMTASQGRMLVKRVGDIELNTDENSTLRTEHSRLLASLASLLDIPNRANLGAVSNVGLVI